MAGTSITVQDTTRNRGVSTRPGLGHRLLSLHHNHLHRFWGHSPRQPRRACASTPPLTDPATTTLNIPTNHANHKIGMAGTYYLFAIADDSAIVAEPDEANNSTTYAVVKIGPDLHISALSTTGTPVAGGSISVQDTTRNRGVSASPASVTTFYLSTTTTLDASAQLLGNRTVPALEAGLTSTMTTTLNIPATVKPANYLLAVADGEDTVAEPLESNNVGLRHPQDRTRPARQRPQRACHRGGWRLHHRPGHHAQPRRLRRPRVGHQVLSRHHDHLQCGQRHPPRKPPRARPRGRHDRCRLHHHDVPTSVGTAGTYYLFGVADGDNAVAEPDEGNNSTTYAIVKIGPDLHISLLTAPATAVPGGSITVQDTTRNRGVSAAPASVTMFYLSTTTTFSAGAVRIGSRVVPELPAGQTNSVPTTLNIPANVGPASFLLAVADGDNTVAEPNELNNVGAADLTIGPDLHVSAVSAPTTAVPGSSIAVQDTTRNRGVGAAPKSVTTFYLSTTATFNASNAVVPLGSRDVPALAAGAQHVATTTVTIPVYIGSASTYYLFAVADGNNALGETDEANNARYDIVRIGPDLYISVLTGPSTAARGATILVNDTTRNRGVSGAPASTTHYYLSTTKTYNGELSADEPRHSRTRKLASRAPPRRKSPCRPGSAAERSICSSSPMGTMRSPSLSRRTTSST